MLLRRTSVDCERSNHVEKPRILFMGTPRFALASLQLLIDRAESILGVVTQPDRPSGRGQQVVEPPVKNLAARQGLPVYQPRKVREDQFIQQVQALAPDLIVVVAFGQILPRALLDIPPRGCINVHASLLPAYRGAAPINWALINGETVTGVTIMALDEGMDTGDILLQKPVSILPDDTAATLHDRLAASGAALLGEALEQLREGAWTRIAQDHARATYAPPMKKEHGRIQWNKSAREIHNQVRGMNPWPGSFTFFRGKLLKIYQTGVLEKNAAAAPGTITAVSDQGIEVAAGNGALLIQELQLEGKKKMRAQEFIQGQGIREGEEFASQR
jgi:methionyl-tRNA formyltransferase